TILLASFRQIHDPREKTVCQRRRADAANQPRASSALLQGAAPRTPSGRSRNADALLPALRQNEGDGRSGTRDSGGTPRQAVEMPGVWMRQGGQSAVLLRSLEAGRKRRRQTSWRAVPGDRLGSAGDGGWRGREPAGEPNADGRETGHSRDRSGERP